MHRYLVRAAIGGLRARTQPFHLQTGDAQQRVREQMLGRGQKLRDGGRHAPHLPAPVQRQHSVLGVVEQEPLVGVEERHPPHKLFVREELLEPRGEAPEYLHRQQWCQLVPTGDKDAHQLTGGRVTDGHAQTRPVMQHLAVMFAPQHILGTA